MHVLKATPEYLTFRLLPRPAGRRTDLWHISDRHGGHLGQIAWESRWRQYVFYTSEFTEWSGGCLLAVVDFIAARMAEREPNPLQAPPSPEGSEQ